MYKEGQEVKVRATRMQVYSQPGYVSKERETIKTLVIVNEIDTDLYLVKIKGLKVPGTKIDRSARWYTNTGTLTSGSPRPLKYETEVIN